MRSIRTFSTSLILVAACFSVCAQQSNTPPSAKQSRNQKTQPAHIQEPDCPFGYYSTAPYSCAPEGFYGTVWFVNGQFTGAGPWYRNVAAAPQASEQQAAVNYPQPAPQRPAAIQEPNCPYGYYSYAPYECAAPGFYGPTWFVNGQFVGAGPWYRNVGVAPSVWEEPITVEPMSCQWGYYGAYPGCAPYGYYSPRWFSGGIFIGAGPWHHGGRYYGNTGYRGSYGSGGGFGFHFGIGRSGASMAVHTSGKN